MKEQKFLGTNGRPILDRLEIMCQSSFSHLLYGNIHIHVPWRYGIISLKAAATAPYGRRRRLSRKLATSCRRADDVHGRHRQTGAIDHAADRCRRARCIGDRVSRPGFSSSSVRSRNATISGWRRRVAVETDLGVEADQLVVLGHHQRIDLQQSFIRVLGGERGIELGQQAPDLLGKIAVEIERLRYLAAVMRHDAGGRIDRESKNFQDGSWRLPRYPCRLRWRRRKPRARFRGRSAPRDRTRDRWPSLPRCRGG